MLVKHYLCKTCPQGDNVIKSDIIKEEHTAQIGMS